MSDIPDHQSTRDSGHQGSDSPPVQETRHGLSAPAPASGTQDGHPPPAAASVQQAPQAEGRAPGRGSPGVQLQLSPLSIQAAALVKCIDGLSNIFWISFAGTFLSIFFASLNQLDANAASDHIFLGEYQVPKSILPLAAVAFALFVFWLTANRLKVLNDALHTTVLPADAVHEIIRLNPPVLHVFQNDSLRHFSPASGVNASSSSTGLSSSATAYRSPGPRHCSRAPISASSSRPCWQPSCS